jgi:predicted HTH transcriptional regulator
MILASLEQITEKTLKELVANAVREKHTLDYKIAVYGNNDEQHREFLADISSFANAIGGDLVIGVQEDSGLPVSVPGIAINADKEFQRMQQMILHGLQPPVPMRSGTPVSGNLEYR